MTYQIIMFDNKWTIAGLCLFWNTERIWSFLLVSFELLGVFQATETAYNSALSHGVVPYIKNGEVRNFFYYHSDQVVYHLTYDIKRNGYTPESV